MKKVVLLIVSVIGLILPAGAQTAGEVRLPLTPDSAALLHVFLPAHPCGRAVMACPGGGYAYLSMRHEGTDWAPFFNAMGYTYAVLTYRLPAGHPQRPLADAGNGIRALRDHASAWHVNPSAVGIMGFSAGGHLAAITAATAPADARPDFQILLYPVITMDPTRTHRGSSVHLLGTALADTAAVRRYSADVQVRRGLTPPAFITFAADDTTVPPLTNGLRYYEALRCAGVSAALFAYPYGGHGYGNLPRFPFRTEMLAELTTWLKALTLAGEAAAAG